MYLMLVNFLQLYALMKNEVLRLLSIDDERWRGAQISVFSVKWKEDNKPEATCEEQTSGN